MQFSSQVSPYKSTQTDRRRRKVKVVAGSGSGGGRAYIPDVWLCFSGGRDEGEGGGGNHNSLKRIKPGVRMPMRCLRYGSACTIPPPSSRKKKSRPPHSRSLGVSPHSSMRFACLTHGHHVLELFVRHLSIRASNLDELVDFFRLEVFLEGLHGLGERST